MARDIFPHCLLPSAGRHQPCMGASLGFILPFSPFHSLMFYSFLTCAAAAGSLPGLEHDYGISPKFVCTPIPPEADPSCYSPPAVPHGPSPNDHSGGTRRGTMSDEAKATILHLRESLVRQKETILDQRETIRELTAKLTLCEGFGGHHSNGHHDNHHSSSSHHDTHHDNHHDDHHGLHSSHHSSPSSYHGPSTHHSNDHHYPHGSHRPDPHHRKGSSHAKHSFSPEQTGKTLQTLKERLENLQARNSSSSYSSSLRELLQRKIAALEEQLHSYHTDHRDYGHHDDHHDDHHGNGGRHDDHHDDHHGNSGRHDDHHDDHHGNGGRHDDHRDDHRGYGHRDDHGDHHDDHHGHDDDHHDDHHGNGHREGHYNTHYSHRYHHSDYNHRYHDNHHDPHSRGHHGSFSSHHRGDHRDDRHDDHRDDHRDYHHRPGHHDDRHDDHHDTEYYPRRLPFPGTGVHGAGHGKLEAVLGQLHHSNDEHGNHQKLKRSATFLLDFPMRTNYVHARVRRSLAEELFALTVCFWVKAGTAPGLGTPFSYAVPGQANELVLIEWGGNPMELLVSDEAATLPITTTDGKWHHVCVTWSTRDGAWEVYQDGVKKGYGQNLAPWHAIKAGGVFILGQEQDTMGGRFDITQSFTGQLSDLQLWSRVLTPSEVHQQATCSSHLTGDVLSWAEESLELHGGLAELSFDPCH